MKEVIDSFMRERKPCSFCVFFSLKIHPALFSWHMCCHVLDGPEDTQSRNKKATRLHLVPKFPYSQGLSRKWPYMYEQLRVAISLMVPMRRAKGGPCCLPPPTPPPPRPHIHSSFPLHFTSGPHPTRVHKAAYKGKGSMKMVSLTGKGLPGYSWSRVWRRA